MNKQTIFNFFLLGEKIDENNDYIIHSLGVKEHQVSGTDEEKMKYLTDNIQKDIKEMEVYPISNKFTTFSDYKTLKGLRYSMYSILSERGSLFLFKDILKAKKINKSESFAHINTLFNEQIKLEKKIKFFSHD